MENPHPQPIYTSSLTSPEDFLWLTRHLDRGTLVSDGSDLPSWHPHSGRSCLHAKSCFSGEVEQVWLCSVSAACRDWLAARGPAPRYTPLLNTRKKKKNGGSPQNKTF